jgi:hypothetical protein
MRDLHESLSVLLSVGYDSTLGIVVDLSSGLPSLRDRDKSTQEHAACSKMLPAVPMSVLTIIALTAATETEHIQHAGGRME